MGTKRIAETGHALSLQFPECLAHGAGRTPAGALRVGPSYGISIVTATNPKD